MSEAAGVVDFFVANTSIKVFYSIEATP
jgi:hypothetical protein